MALQAFSGSRIPSFAIAFIQLLSTPILHPLSSSSSLSSGSIVILKNLLWTPRQRYHDGRPRGPLWRGKRLIGKEALFVILGLNRFKDDQEKLDKFIKCHVLRLLKIDMVAVLTELECPKEVSLALQMFKAIQKQDYYQTDVYLYNNLIIALARCKKMNEAMETYTEVIRGFLKCGSPANAMNIYEDMKNSPDPSEELPFRILLKGLLPHPLLRNRVKQDFEEIFADQHVYDPPEEIFGTIRQKNNEEWRRQPEEPRKLPPGTQAQ
ncbi:Pentatricopeptide repeat [Dillenia turbinata]|uniref:Pentatricopeptide repeat n=1 Tax=Dillenia turbinata TaxID=194707 RepID=A0AAN8ZHC3_9MAGN